MNVKGRMLWTDVDLPFTTNIKKCGHKLDSHWMEGRETDGSGIRWQQGDCKHAASMQSKFGLKMCDEKLLSWGNITQTVQCLGKTYMEFSIDLAIDVWEV